MRVNFYKYKGKLRIAKFSFTPYAGLVHYEQKIIWKWEDDWITVCVDVIYAVK